ncbi:MAG: hypothetical protein HYZ75_01735 [Elusimicrobia bacterium]|nr:hypothetical protein [Elusimicrobiota bacterium]
MRAMEYPSYMSVTGPRLRWPSIFAGVAMTTAILGACNVLGVGLGYLPAGVDAALAPGTAGARWTLASGVPAFYVGGWFASRLSDSGRRSDGVIFGLVCWAASALVALYFPASTLGGAFALAFSGPLVFSVLALEAAAAALGGVNGARLYLPVPVSEYRRTHREIAGSIN